MLGVWGLVRERPAAYVTDPSLRRAVHDFSDELVGDLEPAEAIERIRRRQYVIDYLSLESARDAAIIAADPDVLDPPSPVDYLRHEAKMSRSAAVALINVGEELHRLPDSAEAMRAGEIGFAHLSVMARTTSSIAEAVERADRLGGAATNDAASATVSFDESVLLDKARDCSAGKLWYFCQRLRHALDPAGVAEEQRVSVERRALRMSTWQDGSLMISGQLDPVGGAALRTALEPLARPMGDGDDRCLERRQADALLDLAMYSMDNALLPQTASQRPHLQVTTSLETLLGLPGSPAADLEFSSPISGRTVERIACDATITRVVFGPDSAVVDVGRATRKVSAATRRALNTRDQHCQWPGCERSAPRSAAHHLTHWARGGTTDLSNLILLCHRHHWMVHEGGWKLLPSDDGRLLALPPTYAYPAWPPVSGSGVPVGRIRIGADGSTLKSSQPVSTSTFTRSISTPLN